MRVREVAAIAANGVIVLCASRACSSATAPSWAPGWMTIKPRTIKALRFVFAPPGAENVTVNVERNQSPQTCNMPCSSRFPCQQNSR